MLAYAGVAAYAAVNADRLAGLVAGIDTVGGVLLLVAVARGEEDLLAWALGTVAAAYGVSLVDAGGAVDEAAPLVAAALLLCGELAAWSADERLRVAAERSVERRRAVAVGLLAAAGLAAAALVVAVAAAPPGRGLAWTTLGAAAAVCAVGVGVLVARRSDSLH